MLHHHSPYTFPPKAFLRFALVLTFTLIFLPASQALAELNTPPQFLDTTTQPTIFAADGAYELAPMLHVSDPDTTQTLTWTTSQTPTHGSVSIEISSTPAAGADTSPPGYIRFHPDLGYTGSDTFTITISDGIATADRTFTVMIYASSNQWDGSRATGFAAGTGTIGDPYMVATGGQLAYLADYVNAGNTTNHFIYVALKADIDLNVAEWDPIGHITLGGVYNEFRGVFDGNEHTISNMRIGSPSTPRADILTFGLFGCATDGEITELNLVDVNLNIGTHSDYLFVGGLVGAFWPADANTDYCYVEKVSVSGSIHAGDINSVGLLVGYFQGEARECSTAGSIFTGIETYVGGLFGCVEIEETITGCFNTASIYMGGEGDSAAGGLAAYAEPEYGVSVGFANCYSTGNVISVTSSIVDYLLASYGSMDPRFDDDDVFFNKEAYLISGNNVAPITTYGGNYGEHGLSLLEMQTTMLAMLNTQGAISWSNTTAPNHFGLPKLTNLPTNLGSLPRIRYLANGATSGTVPVDTGSYRANETIILPDNRLALSKGANFSFRGWNTTANGDGQGYAAFERYVLPNVVDLYAAWDSLLPSTATHVNFAVNPRNGTTQYAYEDELTITVSFDKVVTVYANMGAPYLELQLTDSSTIILPYVSGSNSSTLVFKGTVSLPNKSSAGVILSPSIPIGIGNAITDAQGIDITPTIPGAVVPDLSHVLIDSQEPVVTGYTLPGKTSYVAGEHFDLVVNVSEPVYIQTIANPALLLTLDTPSGTTNSFAHCIVGHATTALTFRYTTENGVYDTNGPNLLGQIQMLGSHVTDAAGNPIDDGLLPADLSSYVFDGIDTEVVSVNLTDLPAKSSFKVGDVLHFAVTFNEPVSIKSITFDPDAEFRLFVDATNYVTVSYVSGSGTNTWLFEYPVQYGDFANGTLRVDRVITSFDDLFADAQNHPYSGSFTSAVVQDMSTVIMDGIIPQISTLLLPVDGPYTPGQTLDFVVRYNEVVHYVSRGMAGDYTVAMKLYLDSGIVYVPLTGYWNATTQAISSTPAPDLLFRYTVGATHRDATGIDLRPEVAPLLIAEPYLHEGTHTVQDLVGNQAQLSFAYVNTSGIKLIDPPPVAEEPVVVTKPADASPDPVLVNGEENALGKLERAEANGTVGQTLRVDHDETQTVLEGEEQNIRFSLPFTDVSDEYTGALNGETVKLMERKNTVIELLTPNAAYTLPAHQIKIDQVAEQLGQPGDLRNIEVRVQVADTGAEQVQFIRQAATQQKVQIVVPPVDFTIECVYEDKVVEVQKFSGYVSRMILIPDDVDPASISTAVVLHRDGTLGHVPTKIVLIDGKYYAKINALTNSSYSLVQNQVGFADALGHWAAEAIADMSERMIVLGMTTERFDPQRSVTRAEFVVMLVRALGLEGQGSVGGHVFDDIGDDDWFAQDFKVAHEYGLVAGDAYGLANPYGELTREQAVAMLARAVELAEKDVVGDAATELAGFADRAEVAEYAKEAVAYFVREGLLRGRAGSTLAPRATLTRAEAAVFLQRTLQHCDLID